MTGPRLLAASEIEKLKPLFEAEGHGDAFPLSPLSGVAVLEDGDEIIAFLVLQLVPHFEPLYVHPKWRGRYGSVIKMVEKLVGLLEALLPKQMAYYAFSPNKVVDKLAKDVGMVSLPWKVWAKVR